MKAVLHIGTPKTATTHLQRTLSAGRRALHEAGIVYPDLLNTAHDHITLFCAAHPWLHPFQSGYGIAAQDDIVPFRARLRERLHAVVAADPDALFVMSSENLSGNLSTPEGIANLRDLLAGVFDEISVVVYLRRQDEALLSMYAEFMRKGFSALTFDAFVQQNLTDARVVPYLDYAALLRKWETAFGAGALVPRLFEPQALAGGTVLSDFLALIAADPVDLARRLPAVPQSNVSLSAPALEFLRLIRPVVPFGHQGRANPERARLMPRIDTLPGDPRPVMAAAQSERILAHYAAGNRSVAARYFPDGPDTLFPQDVRGAPDSNLGQLGLEDFKAFFRQVFGDG